MKPGLSLDMSDAVFSCGEPVWGDVSSDFLMHHSSTLPFLRFLLLAVVVFGALLLISVFTAVYWDSH